MSCCNEHSMNLHTLRSDPNDFYRTSTQYIL